MPKARDYHLKDQELAAIENAIRRDNRPGVRRRCIVIHLLHLGRKPEEIATMQAISKPTVYGWYERWKQSGIDGLVTRPRSGRPPKTDEEYRQTLASVLETDPQTLGYDFSIWTRERLRQHLEKVTGTSLSISRLQILLKRNGYRYRRPKYDLGHLQDQPAKEQTDDLLRELKKRPPQTISSSSLWTKRH